MTKKYDVEKEINKSLIDLLNTKKELNDMLEKIRNQSPPRKKLTQ